MGKGGGGSQPTQTTAYQTNLPEYAQPYVMSMLGATQNQLFNTSGTGPDATITGFKPYQPYSSDPTKYFAGPSGLQTSVYNEAAGMQTPGGYAPAQGLTGLAAMQQMGAGRQFERQATDPNAVARYMSPYMQNVVDIQKANAIRDYQKGIPALRQQAAAAGAFGGSRQAIQESEAQRSLLSNLANIQAQGQQNAFQNAQAQQQFGANLGLQGLGAAVSSAGQLGSLAGAQQQADLARMGFQQQTGSAQQQYQQNIINQAIQDYATAQQYPMMQLGFMSNMLRGLPMQATTTQSYMPTPNLTTQAIAGLGTAAGAYKAFGMKAGGKVPSFAGPEGSVVSGMKAKLEALADSPGGVQQVAKIAQTSPSQELRALANEVIMEKQLEQRAAQQAEQSIAQDQAPRGLAAAPAPVLDTMSAAGGGIIAFADEGEVEYDPNKVYNDPYQVLSDAEAFKRAKGRREALGIGDVVSQDYRDYMAKQKADMPGYQDRLAGLELMKWAGKINRPGSTLGAIIGGTGESAESVGQMLEKVRGREAEIAKGSEDIYGKERTDKVGILTGTDKERADALKLRADREKARIAAAQKPTDLMNIYAIKLKALGKNKDINDPLVQEEAMNSAIDTYQLKGPGMDLNAGEKYYKALKDDKQLKSYRRELLQYEEDSKEYKAIEAKIAGRENEIKQDFMPRKPSSAAPEAPTPGEKKDGSGRFPETTGVTVQTPAGPIKFPNKKAADDYKKAAGL